VYPGQEQSLDAAMDVADVAARLRICEATVRRLLRSGQLPGIKIGHCWRIRRQDVDALLAGDR
jgi:excisionase family DNA binding protein